MWAVSNKPPVSISNWHLRPLDFFVAVRAFVGYPTRAAFDGLSIQDSRARARLARGSSPLALAVHRGLLKLGPAPIGLLAVEIIINQRTGWELAR